jgi:photosystem II stability/assembly factor-like uncharacterized protein
MNKIILVFSVLFAVSQLFSQKNKSGEPTKKDDLLNSSTVNGLKFRSIGPAFTSGRVSDIAIHPSNPDKWFVAVASGGVWLTENHGITFEPIFDSYGSYSIACVSIAPSNFNTIWVGTGENNNQRSVAYGDGVYKSVDGGKSFTNMGLSKSEHIGNIIIHPNDENTIWVAAYGPVWSSGGDRGVYKTVDGGKTWKKTLFISEDTGISEIAIDPSNSNILYASAHQRRRTEYTYIGGGPESSLYKSVDGGETWNEINNGLPKNQMGRIGITVSPADPNYVYAIVEARGEKGGFFRSVTMGEKWEKQSSFSTSGNYYQEIICDPKDKNKVFAMDTWLRHTEDGGKNFIYSGEDKKHVDNHAIWINPNNTNHWIVGCDGGIYETYSHGTNWRFYDNLPITQFYKVATDNDYPFYNVYGGTQDNNSMGGPSSTIRNTGVQNSDWFITNGGDGFESAIDPIDPNIAYAQAQYGWIVRFDKKSGEKTPIQPLPRKGEDAYRWNWDAPLLISPHNHKTLYFAANKVFKSTNRGDDWEVISPDLSQQIDRNKLEVMGQVWSMDAVMKNASTTIYGNIVALDESPKQKGLLFAGTDDGCIQISENDGKNWSKQTSFSGIPTNTRVNMIVASPHDENVAFAVFNNHRSGDFKPYLMKTINKGKSWVSIIGNLPERGSVYCVRQDHIDPNLLFVGTEFGAFFTINGGEKWVKFEELPTISIFDLDIQKRENDLILASFGRGFYILDNYSPLRFLNDENLNKKAHLFPVKDALLYVQSEPGTESEGANFFTSENVDYGAVFSIYLKENEKTLKEIRQEKEKELEKNKKPVSYPSTEEMYAEEYDENSKLIFIIRDKEGKEVRRLVKKPSKGITRTVWDLRMESTNPIKISPTKKGRYEGSDGGFLVTPGIYSVEVHLLKNGKVDELVPKTNFNVKPLSNLSIENENQEELIVFRKEVAELNRSVAGSNMLLKETSEKLEFVKKALKSYPNTPLNELEEVRLIFLELKKCERLLNGDRVLSSKEFETVPSISERLGMVEYQLYNNRSKPTKTQRSNLKITQEEYEEFRAILNSVIKRLRTIEEKLDSTPIPYTKGKSEGWKED